MSDYEDFNAKKSNYKQYTDEKVIPLVSTKVKVPNYRYGELENYFIPPVLCAPDEIFVWITHSPICPNVMPGRYLLSNYGRIYDCCRNMFLSYHFNSKENGYCVCKLAYYIDPYTLGSKDVYIHRLVCYFFNFFPYCNKFEVNHVDCNKEHNDSGNLEWVTTKENMEHAVKHKLVKCGEDAHNATITNAMADEIGRLVVAGFGNQEIADMLGISASIVTHIKGGKTFKFVSEKYNTMDYMRSVEAEKFEEHDVHKICKLILEGYSCQSIADMFNCKLQRIKDIKYGRNYKYISDNYNLQSVGRAKSDKMLDDEVVRDICRRINAGQSNASIERDLGLKRNTVYPIKAGKYYSNISSEFGIIPTPSR